jgi:hypothetical protein
MLALGVGAIGTGAYLFYDGRSTITEHNDAATYDEWAAGRGDMDAAKQKQWIGLAAMGGGAALVGGGILFYVLHGRSGDETPPPVTAAVTADHAMVFVGGAF